VTVSTPIPVGSGSRWTLVRSARCRYADLASTTLWRGNDGFAASGMDGPMSRSGRQDRDVAMLTSEVTV